MENYTVILGEDERDKPRVTHSTWSDEKIMLQQPVAFRKSVHALRKSFLEFQWHLEYRNLKSTHILWTILPREFAGKSCITCVK